MTGTIEALDAALAIAGPDTRIVPGHGLHVVGRDTLVEFRDMVVDIRDRVRTMIAEGSTLEDVMAAEPTAAYGRAVGAGGVVDRQRFRADRLLRARRRVALRPLRSAAVRPHRAFRRRPA